jgi:2-iminobutanoate/2-iminopropanoate deaminase
MTKRRAIYIREFSHGNPIPNAARIGSVVASGLIRGVDPVTHALPHSLKDQCIYMFANIRHTIKGAGADVDDIIKVTIWMSPLERGPINEQWIAMFPDPATRPARQIIEVPMEKDVLVQCDFLAVVDAETTETRAIQPPN